MDNKEAEKTNHVEVNEHAPAKTTLSPADTTEIAQMSLLEHEVGKLQSFREYPWACLWCIYAVWLVLLVSFENQAAGTVFGIPKFREDFGHAYTDENGDTGYVIEGHWQAAFQGAPVATYVTSRRALRCSLEGWILTFVLVPSLAPSSLVSSQTGWVVAWS